jgi:hypothetical protein
VARVLGWGLWLAGWIVIAALADRFLGGPFEASMVIALWLLATGLLNEGWVRFSWLGRAARWVLPAAGLLAAGATGAVVHGGGSAALVVMVLAWSVLLALASSAVQGLRRKLPRAAASPVLCAAVGAGIAWLVAGDPADLPGLADRAGGFALVAALGLAALHRAGPAGSLPARTGACRSGAFDCAMPAWPSTGWRDPAAWPLSLATLVMLPMMCSLPAMLQLCRSGALSSSAVLALHLAAMFGPAWCLERVRPVRREPARWAGLCTLLLVVGALVGLSGGPAAGSALVLLHGAAWGVAWWLRLHGAPGPPGGRPRGRAAAGAAAAVLLLGASQAAWGPAAWPVVHAVLAAAAFGGWAVGTVGRAGAAATSPKGARWRGPSRAASSILAARPGRPRPG